MALDLEDRIKGMVYGQLVGDAASLGTHWIYDTEDLLSRYNGEIKGFENPLPGHYHEPKRSGEQTHYGDAALVLIETINECNGRFDISKFGSRFHAHFSSPSYCGYRDHATKDTISNIDAFRSREPSKDIPFLELGSKDDQMASVTSLAPILAIAPSREEALSNVEAFTLIRQNNSKAVAYSKTLTLILLKLLEAEKSLDAVQSALREIDGSNPFEREAKQRIQLAITMIDISSKEATAKLGQSCPLEGSLPSAIHTFLKHDGNFRESILETIKAGGDNAGRASIIGGLSGAAYGIQEIPSDWIMELKSKDLLDQFFVKDAN